MTTTNGAQRKDKLEELNQLFANRYTNTDQEYLETTNRSSCPPVVADWGPDPIGRGPQQSNNNNQRRPFSNPRQGHRHYSNHHEQYQHQSNNNRYHGDRSRSPRDHRHRDRSRSPHDRHRRQ